MNPFTLLGAFIGGLVGALLWVVAIASSGTPWGGLALAVGAGAGAGAVLCDSRPANAMVIAIMVLVLCVCAKGVGLFVSTMNPGGQARAELEYTQEEYLRFMNDAVELRTVQPDGYAAFIQNRRFYDADQDGTASPEEIQRFQTFWMPRLQAWDAAPPLFAEWVAAMQADMARTPQSDGGIRRALGENLSPLALMAVVLAVVGAYLGVHYFSKAEASLDRDRIEAGIIDLNADVGTRINIQMAAPGQKAVEGAAKPRNDTRITDRVKRASAGRPTGQIIKKPAPKNTLRDQPPGMK